LNVVRRSRGCNGARRPSGGGRRTWRTAGPRLTRRRHPRGGATACGNAARSERILTLPQPPRLHSLRESNARDIRPTFIYTCPTKADARLQWCSWSLLADRRGADSGYIRMLRFIKKRVPGGTARAEHSPHLRLHPCLHSHLIAGSLDPAADADVELPALLSRLCQTLWSLGCLLVSYLWLVVSSSRAPCRERQCAADLQLPLPV
jgi:hypothetical protein